MVWNIWEGRLAQEALQVWVLDLRKTCLLSSVLVKRPRFAVKTDVHEDDCWEYQVSDWSEGRGKS